VSHKTRPMKCPMRGRQPGHRSPPAFHARASGPAANSCEPAVDAERACRSRLLPCDEWSDLRAPGPTAASLSLGQDTGARVERIVVSREAFVVLRTMGLASGLAAVAASARSTGVVRLGLHHGVLNGDCSGLTTFSTLILEDTGWQRGQRSAVAPQTKWPGVVQLWCRQPRTILQITRFRTDFDPPSP
jgi:hypothetical protein